MRSLSIIWGYNAWWLLDQVFPDLVGFFSCSQFLQCASHFLLIFIYAAAMLDSDHQDCLEQLEDQLGDLMTKMNIVVEQLMI